jgi:hypothetical protein
MEEEAGQEAEAEQGEAAAEAAEAEEPRKLPFPKYL